jgi:pyrroline-5-carboxylate reductase
MKVTTPKGCTIAGLNEMEMHGFMASLIRGIKLSKISYKATSIFSFFLILEQVIIPHY